ncbi:hypothetical protein ACFC18_54265, partial [Streptomyces sp. NPDC056121]
MVLLAVELLEFGLEVRAHLPHADCITVTWTNCRIVFVMSELGSVKRQFGHRARLALSAAEHVFMDEQAHAARTVWNCLHAWWQMMPKDKRTLVNADAAIRQARKEVDFLAVLPAQAAQAVLKTYFQAWKNCW